MKKLAVIIVNYNVKYYVEQCLHSVMKAAEGIDTEIFVVDNHSQDNSVEYLSERFPRINIIGNTNNLGFSRANNIAIKQSDSQYVLLLNPDTIVGENSLRACVDFLDVHEKAGAAGVRMLQDTGKSARESRRGLPTPLVAFYKMCGLTARFPKSKRFGHYYMSDLSWDEPGKIEVISGAFFMVRREVLDKVGLLDQDFFMYGEDIDLSYRILKGGYENWYIPQPILHYKGESTQKSSFRYVHVFYDAMLIFFRKHYAQSSWLFSLPIKTAIYAKATAALIEMQLAKARKSMGFIDRTRLKQQHYYFIGSQENIDDCRQIARRRALDASFLVADDETLVDGYPLCNIADGGIKYVVYDTKSYSYETIFRIFMNNAKENVFIGTYNPDSKIIITPDDILL